MKIHKGMCISIDRISNRSYKKSTTGFFLTGIQLTILTVQIKTP